MLALFLAGVHPVSAGEWHHVRGPDYDGHSVWTNLYLPWSEAGPPVLWRAALAQGYSGCVIADGRVYTQVQARRGQFVVCLDLATGEEEWRTRYGVPWENDGKWPGPYSSPTFADGKIFFAGCYGTVGALDAVTGEKLWSVRLVEDLGAQIPGFGYAGTPLVFKNKVYLATSGDGCSVLALDAGTGDLVWRTGDDPVGYAPCITISVDGRPQIISLMENVNVAHDPETGDELWRFVWSDTYDPHCTWPLYEEPYLFRASPFRAGACVLKLGYSDGKPTSELVWRSKVICHCIFTAVIVDGYVYGFDIEDQQTKVEERTRGRFKCVDLATGVEKWSTDKIGHCAVMACGDKLILLDERGLLLVAEANPEGYYELARHEVLPDKQAWTFPTLCDGRLLVRSHEELVCLYLGDPEDIGDAQVGRVVGCSWSGNALDDWLDRYQDYSFWAPNPQDQLRWYLGCLIVALFPAMILACLLRKSKFMFPVAAGTAIVGGLVGTPLLSRLLGRAVFTIPATLFGLFAATLWVGMRARERGGKTEGVVARIVLLLFLLVCLGYYWLCDRMFLIVGWFYLTGFVPAGFVCVPVLKKVTGGKAALRAGIIWLLAFTVYFWASSLVGSWRTGSSY